MQPAILPEAQPDLKTARTLALVALIVEIVVLAIVFPALLVFLGASARIMSGGFPGTPAAAFSIILFTVEGPLWVLVTYFLVYTPLRQGQVNRALTPTIVNGIAVFVLERGCQDRYRPCSALSSLRPSAPPYCPESIKWFSWANSAGTYVGKSICAQTIHRALWG